MNPTCLHCSKPMAGRRPNAKFCSTKCRHDHSNAKFQDRNPRHDYAKLSPSRVGAIQEMLVCADLAKRGLSVFRSVSPSEECDIIVMRGPAKLFRVEVTTGYRNKDGSLFFPPKQPSRFDLLAVVEKSGQITYHPEIDVLKTEQPAYTLMSKAGPEILTHIPA